jgi:hypothetical protein
MTPIVAARIRKGKGHAGPDHQQRARDQDASAAEPIRARGEPERDERVSHQRQGQDDPDRHPVESECGEVQDEDHGQRAITEHPQDAGGEQEPTVPIQAADAGDETVVDGLAGGRRQRSVATGRVAADMTGKWDIDVQSTCENAVGGDQGV